ncbi:LON peptidase substrate-binding domain-containing protein [Benzoatithermus flavus]|uniref:LON peptidase substrate-binding domain-containing protein n=1 Tax=Benzoatithermus flavus TaxID=3108223 RepID=A0ABU8XMG0_9PROT
MADLASSLPRRFPIFPLRGALLLPGGNLPLNIFEPRYLRMVRDAMQTDRVIGMIQPKTEDDPSPAPALYRTGCVGRISSLEETTDGRLLITLTGVCRFDVTEELEVATPYRQVEADFGRWRQDLYPALPPAELKAGLLGVLRAYFDRHGIEADWSTIDAAPLAGLVTSLCMICPFEAEEKQALLEAPDMGRQAELLIALMRMEALAEPGGSTLRH